MCCELMQYFPCCSFFLISIFKYNNNVRPSALTDLSLAFLRGKYFLKKLICSQVLISCPIFLIVFIMIIVRVDWIELIEIIRLRSKIATIRVNKYVNFWIFFITHMSHFDAKRVGSIAKAFQLVQEFYFRKSHESRASRRFSHLSTFQFQSYCCYRIRIRKFPLWYNVRMRSKFSYFNEKFYKFRTSFRYSQSLA